MTSFYYYYYYYHNTLGYIFLVQISMSKFTRSSKIWEKLEESDWRFFAIFVRSATQSGLVIINMTKNCAKWQATQKIVIVTFVIAIFPNFCKFCYNGQLALGFSDY